MYRVFFIFSNFNQGKEFIDLGISSSLESGELNRPKCEVITEEGKDIITWTAEVECNCFLQHLWSRCGEILDTKNCLIRPGFMAKDFKCTLKIFIIQNILHKIR